MVNALSSFKQMPRRGKVVSLIFLFFLLLATAVTVYQVGQRQKYQGEAAGVRPLCPSNDHNECPNNWGYCFGGECWSYTTGGGVGAGCNNNNDCGNMMLNCVNGRCQRVVGEVGGCRVSQDCADQYRNTALGGYWACLNSQCIKLGGRPNASDQYFNGTNWVSYGTQAACVHNSDCGPGALCDEYACDWYTNRNPCHYDGECGLLPSDPNKKYVCVDSAGRHIGYGGDGSATGTCVVWDACDPRLIRLNGIIRPCGPGTHCEVKTWGERGSDRRAFCVADAGTTASAGQTPQGWTTISCPGGTVIERCSNTANNQRVRYCSNDPNFATNAIRWNGWVGPSDQFCATGGELWGVAPRDPKHIPPRPSNVPAKFYDTTGCALKTRVERCSNTYPGQRVSYCTEDEANPERSVVRVDNWVGPNGKTCGLTGEIVPSATSSSVPKASNTPSSGSSSGGGSNKSLSGLSSGRKAKGDVSNDGKVDIIDIGVIIDNYGSTNSIGDVNGDGIVNIVDIGILIDNYGK